MPPVAVENADEELSTEQAEAVFAQESAREIAERTGAPLPEATDDAAAKAATEEKAKAEADVAAKAKAAEAARVAADPITKIETRLRNVEGHYGNINAQLGKITEQFTAFAAAAKAAPKGDAPTPAEIAAAAEDPAEWKQLKEDYPDIAKAMEARLAGFKPAATAAAPDLTETLKPINEAVQGSTAQIAALQETVAKLTIETRHRGWEETVNTPEFAKWLETVGPEVKALAASPEPAAAIRMLDLYTEAQAKASQVANVQDARDKRQAKSAAQTKGTKVPVALDDDQLSEAQIFEQEAAAELKRRNAHKAA